jgi:hypothetical protein
MSDLSVWTPVTHEVSMGGVTFTVAPLKAKAFADMQQAAKLLTPFLTEARFHEIAVEGYGAMAKVVAIGTGQPLEWIHTQDSDQVLDLLGLVFETNMDFSRRRMVPALEKLSLSLRQSLMPGAAPSPDSGS